MDQVNLNEIEKNKTPSPERALEAIPPALLGQISVENWNLLTLEQRDILKNIEKIPEELMGVVPESVWETLSVTQKLEFIYSHNLLERQPTGGPEQVREAGEEEGFSNFRHQVEGESVQAGPMLPSETSSEGSSTEQLGSQFEEIKKEISEIEQVSEGPKLEEEQPPVEEYIAPDDVESISQSSGATFSENMVPKLAGYQPDDSFYLTVEESANGDPKQSSTWAANIIEKFKAKFKVGE